MTNNYFPAGLPTSMENLIQNNWLTPLIRESMRPNARYAEDARRSKLPPGVGGTMSMHRLGLVDVDLKPAPTTGAPDYGQFEVERWTAQPISYAKAFPLNALQNYAQVGAGLVGQIFTRGSEWSGRTKSRLARGRLMHHAGGFSIIRRAQTSGHSVLLVNSLAGFRFKHVNGVPVAVSATNKLPVTIVAATTITSLSVTGVTPLDPNFPDGPGELTLDSTFGANVAAQSYVFVQGANTATPRTFIQRAGSRASTEALLSTDVPTLADVIAMKAKLVGRGVPPHPQTGAYHLHVDETFVAAIWNDTAWRQAFQGQGVTPLLGPGSYFLPMHGIVVVENNDSPARGRGKEVAVGDATHSGAGGAGTPGSSISMEDTGLDVVNSSGVYIRRAVMTGAECLEEAYIDHREILALNGVKQIHEFGDVQVMDLNGLRFLTANVEGWTVMIRPALDERALTPVVTFLNYLDYVLPTDLNSGTDVASGSPLKRAVWLEYGSTS